jgi:hypothetical protein
MRETTYVAVMSLTCLQTVDSARTVQRPVARLGRRSVPALRLEMISTLSSQPDLEWSFLLVFETKLDEPKCVRGQYVSGS